MFEESPARALCICSLSVCVCVCVCVCVTRFSKVSALVHLLYKATMKKTKSVHLLYKAAGETTFVRGRSVRLYKAAMKKKIKCIYCIKPQLKK
jgi:hypothetical protein